MAGAPVRGNESNAQDETKELREKLHKIELKVIGVSSRGTPCP